MAREARVKHSIVLAGVKRHQESEAATEKRDDGRAVLGEERGEVEQGAIPANGDGNVNVRLPRDGDNVCGEWRGVQVVDPRLGVDQGARGGGRRPGGNLRNTEHTKGTENQ